MGSLASIENLNDPQKQLILRGHDMQLTAMAISPSGKYLATGQFGTKNFKGCAGINHENYYINLNVIPTELNYYSYYFSPCFHMGYRNYS